MKNIKPKMLLVNLIFLLIMLPLETRADAEDITRKDYIIGSGDVLQILVWDHDDLNRDVTISQNESFSFPLIGKITTAGRSVQDIENILTQKLGDGYLVAPQIAVTVLEYNNKKVFLFGEVQRPGSYSLRKKIQLLELISEAGGFTDDRGAVCQIVRTKASPKASGPISVEEAAESDIITINLNLLTSGQLQENMELKSGDSIYIHAKNHIFVTGEVKKPGEITWLDGMTVRQAISIAGGGTSAAALNRTTIVRLKKGRETEVKPDLSDPVLPNDIIKVPESYF